MVDQSLTGLLNNPVGWGVQAYSDLWGNLFSSREDKAKAMAAYIPFGTQVYGAFTPKAPKLTSEQWKSTTVAQIGTQKAASTEAKEFWEKKVVVTTDIPSPNLPDFGGYLKWGLIAVFGLAALYVALKARK